jgi:hypothetical protein
MLVSTTVASVLSFRPRVTLRSTASATARSLRRSSVSGPTSFAQRMSVVSSGAASRYSRQNRLKTRESETLRSVASKLQSYRRLTTSILRITSTGVERRPSLSELGRRLERSALICKKSSSSSSSRSRAASSGSMCRRNWGISSERFTGS